MELMFDVLIPKPIGVVFCHRHLKEGRFCEHHESNWISTNGTTYSVCDNCGTKALFVNVPVDKFNER